MSDALDIIFFLAACALLLAFFMLFWWLLLAALPFIGAGLLIWGLRDIYRNGL